MLLQIWPSVLKQIHTVQPDESRSYLEYLCHTRPYLEYLYHIRPSLEYFYIYIYIYLCHQTLTELL